ncbi:hypothetical protein NCC78_29620 [Micromonospora phytophila]|uniref:hypothetical protein n=1 Tax=Micromonospora phytophila TaxID=709888 RepID=UPI002030650C|nr:hypothetical protein [Micromonospora phytophila]MCM0678801.1 hypothetical protein [Micromonospora phytophila]
MRGGLDETLARMARREEALRRRATDQSGPDDGDAAVPPSKPAGGEVSRPEGRNAGPGWADAREAPPARVGAHGAAAHRDPVEEVAEAVRRVVAGHPGMAVTVRVEHGGQAYPLRIAWTGTGVTVSAEAAVPPPVWPMSVKTVPAPGQEGLSPDPAVRLAEMIRRDPSLLTDGDPPR